MKAQALTGDSSRLAPPDSKLARDFLASQGISPAEVDTVWTAIALHTTPGIPQHMHPVVALLTTGVEMDVLGIAYDEFSPADREAVVRAFAHAALQGRHHPGVQ